MEILTHNLQKINMDNTLDDYQVYNIDDFIEKINRYTYGLNKIIPWTQNLTNGFILSGGLLYDAIIDRNKSLNSLMDIDLFFYGNSEYKLKTLSQILINLTDSGYKYLVGYNKSVVYIFIQGIPRIIQLIFTSKSNPEEIINSFDLTHLQSFWNGQNLYSKLITIRQFNDYKTLMNPTHNKIKPSRLIKYLKRGVDVNELLYNDYNFILDRKQHFEFKKQINQTKLYNDTDNLTKLDNKLSTVFKADFELYLSNIFWCKIITTDKLTHLINNNYYLIDNKIIVKEKNNNSDEIIELFGDLENYTKLVLEGDFDNTTKSFDLDLEDDVLEHVKLFDIYKLRYQTQRYVYIPCKIIQKWINLNNEYTFDLQITNNMVINYLIGLTDDVYNDLMTYEHIKKNNNNNNIYNIFTFPFRNSLTFPKIKSKYIDNNDDNEDNYDNEIMEQENNLNEYITNGIINEYGLIWKINIKQSIYMLYEIGTNLNIMCEISLYSNAGQMINQRVMFGLKLNPISFDEN